MQKERVYFLDNLKVLLTLLVIVHHVGQPYGGSNGFWYYQSHDHVDLGRFFSVNAGFFMSLFFLISAYFVPSSFAKKGVRLFLKDRLIRLGIPLLIGFLLLMPLLMYGYYIHFRGYGWMSFWDYYVSVYFGIGGMPENWSGPTFPDMQFGHLWFIEHLLVYALLYSLFSLLWKEKTLPKRFQSVTNSKLVLFALVTSLFTFFTRTVYPIDHWEGLLGIIQIEYAHFPQYLSFFILGIIAFRANWLMDLYKKVGVTWLAIGITLAGLRYFTDMIPYAQGGWNIENVMYSFAETFMCYGLGFGFLYLGKTYGNKTSHFLKKLAENSFAAYVFHVPIVVLIQYALTHAELSAAGKFGIASILAVIITFVLSMLLRKISVIRKIL